MRRLGLLILLVPVGYLAVQAGWPGLIAILTVTAAVLGFLLLKDTPSRNRVVFFVTAFVLQALLIAWGLRWSLKRIELALAANETDRPLFDLFAGSDLLQNFWAIVGGVLIAGLLFGLLFLLATLFEGARHTKTPKDPADEPFKMALYRALGLAPAKWVIRNGEIITAKAPKPPQAPDTGPGVVEVQRGHAVILEKEGVVSRVLPTGARWVQPLERIAMVVPLYGRGRKVVVRHAATLDGLQIEEMEIYIFHKVSDEAADTSLDDEKSHFNQSTVKDKVWSASGQSWEGGVEGVTDREARALIATYTMEKMLTLDSSERESFLSQLAARVNVVTDQFMGVRVTITGIGAINGPDLAAEKLMAGWTSAKDNEIILKTAETRRDAFNLLFHAMSDAVKDGADVKDLVAMSFVERMERVEGEPAGGNTHDLEALSKLYVVEALKNLTERAGNRGTTGES